MSSTGSTGRPAAGPTASRSTIPRTGEIIKGSVLLGSLRARQDMMIFQALVGAGLTGTGDPNDPITATLARIRQLGAHEVGHAIGLAHNFAASTPGPLFGDGLSRAARDAGERRAVAQGCLWRRRRPWDKWVIDWLYGAKTDAEAAPMLAQARAQGLRFVADEDCAPGQLGQSRRRLVGRRRRPDRRARADDGSAAGRARSASDGASIPARRVARQPAPRVRSDLASSPLSNRGRGQVAGRSGFPLRAQP